MTKSGTNQFRGSLYDIERNSDWNSNSWANVKNGDPKPVSNQRDWGYSLGGPIGKPGGGAPSIPSGSTIDGSSGGRTMAL